MAEALNTRLVGHLDCPGGGQVWVDGRTLFIGHMHHPDGTTLVDVSNPREPRVRARVEIPKGWHSHKVRAANGVMLVNNERYGHDNPEFGGGLGIYDVANPASPRLITKWRTAGGGVHRFSFDGRYAYISPTAEGYTGNIMMILDLADPARLREVGRWAAPGQWTAGGEQYPGTEQRELRCHHPLRLGNRLYVSYWHYGRVILDIENMAHPRTVVHLNTSANYPSPTHTCLPISHTVNGRRVMVVSDEDVAKLRPAPPSFAWIYDITDETAPVPISTFRVAGLDRDGSPQPDMTGCHQPSERVAGLVIPFAWFSCGLRLVDISDPFAPREAGYYTPDVPEGHTRVSSNDVTIDDRGLIYLIDRQRGLDIIESSAL
ncbi:MAG: LVIVD repeat-containing protein [Candidatus Binataceae bacterium]